MPSLIKTHMSISMTKGLIGLGAVLCALISTLPAQAETLQEALISAYNTNPRLKAERARVKEVDENYVQARAQGRLSSSITGTSGAQAVRAPTQSLFGRGGREINEGYPRSLRLQVIQPIYQGGRVKALKNQASSSIMAARQALRSAEQNLLVAVATAYVDVIRDEETARIRRNNVSVLARQEQAARDRFDVGEGTLTDIAQAQSRLAGANIGLAQADAQLASSRASYVRSVGHTPVDLQEVPRFVMPPTLHDAQRIGVANNPQMLASKFNIKAAKAGVDVARSAGKPTFSINGSLANQRAQISGISEVDSASLTAQLRIPLYSGGLNKSRVRQARVTVERLSYETIDIEHAIEQTVAQIWATLKASERSLIAAQQQVAAAEVAFEGVTLEQQVGTRNTLDVLNAEQELLEAKLTVVNATRTLNATTYQLLSVLGGFDADSLQLPVDLYDPSLNLRDIKNDGMSRAVDKYVPVAVKKIGRQLPNIPKDVIGLTKSFDLPGQVVREVGGFASGVAIGLKDGVDVLTGQKQEAKRIKAETAAKLADEDGLDDAPIILSLPQP